MRRSGITSRSKWASFSRNQTSCKSCGPRAIDGLHDGYPLDECFREGDQAPAHHGTCDHAYQIYAEKHQDNREHGHRIGPGRFDEPLDQRRKTSRREVVQELQYEDCDAERNDDQQTGDKRIPNFHISSLYRKLLFGHGCTQKVA